MLSFLLDNNLDENSSTSDSGHSTTDTKPSNSPNNYMVNSPIAKIITTQTQNGSNKYQTVV